jgi:hypothetical protein
MPNYSEPPAAEATISKLSLFTQTVAHVCPPNQQFPPPIPVDWQLAYSDVSPSVGKSLAGQIKGAYVPEDTRSQ